MADPNEIKMGEVERRWWENVRRRGALWYVVNKGLLFLAAFPAVGCLALGWAWEPRLLAEGWFLGLVSGSLVWMRKELRYRFTLDVEGLAYPDGQDE